MLYMVAGRSNVVYEGLEMKVLHIRRQSPPRPAEAQAGLRRLQATYVVMSSNGGLGSLIPCIGQRPFLVHHRRGRGLTGQRIERHRERVKPG
ncbi:MAG: hypothetical protein AAFV29_18095, partial [Myxococcota bacterium]